MGIFDRALQEMRNSGFCCRPPERFQDYCRRYGLSAETAPNISVDSLDSLDRTLRGQAVMVPRLGTGQKTTEKEPRLTSCWSGMSQDGSMSRFPSMTFLSSRRQCRPSFQMLA